MTTVAHSSKIADIILRRGGISAETLKGAQERAQAASVRLEKYLIDNSLITSSEAVLCLAEYLRMAPITLAHFTPNPQLLESIPAEVLRKRQALPI